MRVVCFITGLIGIVVATVSAQQVQNEPQRQGGESLHESRQLRGKSKKGGSKDDKSDEMKIGYNITAVIDASECFDPVGWCETDLLEILVKALGDNGIENQDFVLLLNGLQAYFCNGATHAFENATAFIRGEGEFHAKRRGKSGAVTQIRLNAGLDVSTIALANVQATASNKSESQAYIYRRVASTNCGYQYAASSLRYWLCVSAQGTVDSKAIGYAHATGSGSAAAGNLASSDVSVFVDAKDITEFNASLSTSATSFAAANASAATYAYASAYTNALLDVSANGQVEQYRYNSCLYTQRRWTGSYYTYVCVGGYHYGTISSHSFRSNAAHVETKVANSFAQAYASSLAAVGVKATIPAYYKHHSGGKDTFIFPEGIDDIPIEISSHCIASDA